MSRDKAVMLACLGAPCLPGMYEVPTKFRFILSAGTGFSIHLERETCQRCRVVWGIKSEHLAGLLFGREGVGLMREQG